jgi:triosephosphate isomerase
MYTTAASARDLATAIVRGLDQPNVRVAVCPPFPYLTVVGDILRGSPVAMGAQNLYPANEGAFTGEVSPTMLADVGCRYVILGHSERRHVLGEADEFINRKVHAALVAGLSPVFCVGETPADRQADRTESVLNRQLTEGLKGVPADRIEPVVIAYEPVWAIGTGINATPEQAQAAHLFLRRRFAQLYGDGAADRLTILYGGSANPDNVKALLSQADVDGGLVGGASLKADLFLAVVRIAGA